MKREVVVSKLLFKSIPGIVLTLYILATVLMNLLASVALVNEKWLALDAGILVSFIGFILSDMIVKRFGTGAAIRVTILGFVINLSVAGLFTIVAFIAKQTNGSFALSDYATLTQWWIIGASAIAFLLSGILDAVIHHAIVRAFKKNPDGFMAHAVSAWGSTFIGQAFDNLLFGLLFTFPAAMIGLWGMSPMTFQALFGLALAGGVIELLCQVLFTKVGYNVAESWRKNNVGQEYLDYISNKNIAVKQ